MGVCVTRLVASCSSSATSLTTSNSTPPPFPLNRSNTTRVNAFFTASVSTGASISTSGACCG